MRDGSSNAIDNTDVEEIERLLFIVATSSCIFIVAGKFDNQYLVGSDSPLGHSTSNHTSSRNWLSQ
jgi:hypothetical protein